jgi:hypothetical protein
MKFELTKHAKKVLAERGIPIEWMERTLAEPELRQPDPDDAAVSGVTGGFPNSAGGCCAWRSTRRLNQTGW